MNVINHAHWLKINMETCLGIYEVTSYVFLPLLAHEIDQKSVTCDATKKSFSLKETPHSYRGGEASILLTNLSLQYKLSLIYYIIPAKPMHNHDIVSVHFNHFHCMRICDKLSKHLSMLTYIYLNMDECWLTSSMP